MATEAGAKAVEEQVEAVEVAVEADGEAAAMVAVAKADSKEASVVVVPRAEASSPEGDTCTAAAEWVLSASRRRALQFLYESHKPAGASCVQSPHTTVPPGKLPCTHLWWWE